MDPIDISWSTRILPGDGHRFVSTQRRGAFTTSSTLDALGNLEALTDADGHTTRVTETDDRGLPTAWQDAVTTGSMTRDALDRPTRIGDGVRGRRYRPNPRRPAQGPDRHPWQVDPPRPQPRHRGRANAGGPRWTHRSRADRSIGWENAESPRFGHHGKNDHWARGNHHRAESR